MNKTLLLAAITLATAAGAVQAQETDTGAADRQQRMNEAYGNARSGSPSGGVRGDLHAAGHSFHNGVRATGHAIHGGVRATGHAIHQGVRATGHAIHHGVDKVSGN